MKKAVNGWLWLVAVAGSFYLAEQSVFAADSMSNDEVRIACSSFHKVSSPEAKFSMNDDIYLTGNEIIPNGEAGAKVTKVGKVSYSLKPVLHTIWGTVDRRGRQKEMIGLEMKIFIEGGPSFSSQVRLETEASWATLDVSPKSILSDGSILESAYLICRYY